MYTWCQSIRRGDLALIKAERCDRWGPGGLKLIDAVEGLRHAEPEKLIGLPIEA